MNAKDAAVEKALAELGLREEPQLSPEQEALLKQALDPTEQFYFDIEKLFKKCD